MLMIIKIFILVGRVGCNTLARNPNGSMSLVVEDMFTDKDQSTKMIREFPIEEGFCLQRIRNESTVT